MAESKNIFVKSKMNKDLDDRLLQQGEYRNAVNIQVSKSESEDVGALENILGNIKTISTGGNGAIVGYLVSEQRSALYLFTTNNTISGNPDGQTPRYDPTRWSQITEYVWDGTQFGSGKTLVDGAFLNFWEGAPITAHLLEDFLFFTDNRNQPRKININLANPNNTFPPTHYQTEDDISVAKYTPYVAPLLYQEITQAMADNFNAPYTGLGVGEYQTTMQDVVSEKYPSGIPTPLGEAQPYYNDLYQGDPDYLENKFVRFGYRFQYEDNEYSVFSPFTQECFIPKQDGYFLEGDEQQTVASTVVSFLENKVNQITLRIPMPSVDDPALPATTLDNVTDQFKIKNVEILYKESDEIRVLVVDTISKSDIKLQFATNPTNILEYTYSGTKPFKTLPEAQTVRVYDKVPVKAKTQEIISNRVVYGNFQTKHTPPSNLNYNVGVDAKQSFNLGNYNVDATTSIIEYPNHSLKQNRNYQVGFVFADRFGRATSTVLSNAGTAIATSASQLSTVYSSYNPNTVDSVTWPGDSLIVQFNTEIDTAIDNTTLYPGVYNGDPATTDYNPLGFYSWKAVVKQQEQDYYTVYLPSAMKGNPYFTTPPTADQNASYVTLINDNINKIPRDLKEVGPQDKSFRSSVILYGRVENTESAFSNIGNVQYYPERRSFTTNVIEDLFDIFDVADFDATGTAPPITNDNNPYFAFFRSESNPFIAEFITSQTAADQFGITNIAYTNSTVYDKFENLTVLETDPVESRLDIYWETSTSGTIADLNELVANTSGTTIFSLENFNFEFIESFEVYSGNATTPESIGRCVVNSQGPFYFENVFGSIITDNIDLISFEASNSSGVISSQTGQGTATGQFQCVKLPQGDTTTINGTTYGPFAYDSFYIASKDRLAWTTTNQSAGLQTYTFSITVEDTVGAPGVNVTKTVGSNQLDNVNTTIELPGSPPSPALYQYGYTQTPAGLVVLEGTNGGGGDFATNGPTAINQAGLQWSITSVRDGSGNTVQTGNTGVFTMNNNTTLAPPAVYGIITETVYGAAAGTYNISILLNGPDGTSDTATYDIIIGEEQADGSFEDGNNEWIGGVSGSSQFGRYQPLNPGGGAAHVISFHNDALNFNSNQVIATVPSASTVGWNNGEFASCTGVINTTGPKFTDCISVKGGGGGFGLSSGTGYIKITYNLAGTISNSTYFNLVYELIRKSSIEYRANASSSWIAAEDIEGNVLSANTSIGGIFNPLISPGYGYAATPASGTVSRNARYGALDYTTTLGTVKGQVQQWSGLGASNNTMLVTTYVAIGNSPHYGSGTGFGQYRLSTENLSGNSTECSGAPMGVHAAINLEVNCGDFYYGFGNNRAFAYKINLTGYGSHTQAFSQPGYSANTIVYAREPIPKYVTKFYTDVNLTQELNLGSGTSPSYYLYRPSDTVTAGASFVANAPSNTSITMAEGAEVAAPDPVSTTSTDQSERKWAAAFLRPTGGKIAGTAQPFLN